VFLNRIDSCPNSPYSDFRVHAINLSWSGNSDRPEAHWSDTEGSVRYQAPWLNDPSLQRGTMKLEQTLPDFAKLSPFGGRNWFTLNRVR